MQRVQMCRCGTLNMDAGWKTNGLEPRGASGDDTSAVRTHMYGVVGGVTQTFRMRARSGFWKKDRARGAGEAWMEISKSAQNPVGSCRAHPPGTRTGLLEDWLGRAPGRAPRRELAVARHGVWVRPNGASQGRGLICTSGDCAGAAANNRQEQHRHSLLTGQESPRRCAGTRERRAPQDVDVVRSQFHSRARRQTCQGSLCTYTRGRHDARDGIRGYRRGGRR